MSGYAGTMETATVELTAQDRCDRCGAQAVVRRGFKTGTLDFCGHHNHEYAVKIAEQEIQEVPC